ncbi:MAG: 50S ribosomal protein L37ae [Candidatus Woesearchaeota archaeon]
MVKKVKGRGGRFGVRYGKSIREKMSRTEGLVQKNKKSPFCNKNTVRRLSSGLWECTKTGIKFTGKAYAFDPKGFVSKETGNKQEYFDLEENSQA